ncbi:MAG: hypothetical protein KatS3mg001_148 [Candidatus Pacearchaeota archaeon]|nr:MAG: hypothetical protein KatS3mg001_148 [Candidatus Pacearchaeota archaeon]
MNKKIKNKFKEINVKMKFNPGTLSYEPEIPKLKNIKKKFKKNEKQRK